MGDRAAPLQPVMSFLIASDVQIVGIFSQNGLKSVKPGATIQFALASNPGHLYTSSIEEILRGIGEGQIATSGAMTKLSSFAMTDAYPARIRTPPELAADLRIGMSGTGTVYAENSASFDFFGWMLLYARSLALTFRYLLPRSAM